MQPNPLFLEQPRSFWAYVRSLSQELGYTVRGEDSVKVPTIIEMILALSQLGLDSTAVGRGLGVTELGRNLRDYFQYRADTLNRTVEPMLMNVEQASAMYERLKLSLSPRLSCPVPMNKQKGDKKTIAYFTAMINMLVDANIGEHPCDHDPRELTTFTRDRKPVRTLARRIDGAFPSAVNPVAVWEIKEYYHTTTFGSRVADGVYETLLDGMELEEMREAEKIHAFHCLMVDAHYTWWDCGKSYLCRILDMLNMGYVDEVLFGTEIEQRLPVLVRQWVSAAEARHVST